MHEKNPAMKQARSTPAWKRRLAQAAAVAVLAAVSQVAGATVYNLADSNSTMTVDSASADGVSSWSVDGTNQLYQQWYWYRIGSSGPETPISSLNLLGANLSDTNFNPGNDHLSLLYGDGSSTGNSTFTIQLSLGLTGGAAGSRMSDLATQLTFTNLTSSGQNVHLFQYSDFDLSGNPLNDQAMAANANTIVQTDGGMIETDSAAPAPSAWQIAPYSQLVDSLSDGSPTTLDNSGSGGVGDMTYARVWDAMVNPAGSASSSVGFSTDQHITVPDPGTVFLLAAGMLGLAGANRARRRDH